MISLRAYLDTLPHGEQSRLAERLGISPAYLYQLAEGIRNPSPLMVLAIERETGGGVTVADLRPEFAESLERAGYVRIPADERAAA